MAVKSKDMIRTPACTVTTHEGSRSGSRWQRMKPIPPTQHRYTRVHPGDGTHTNDTPMKAAWRSSQRTPACTVTTHEGSRSGSRWQRMKPIPPTQHRYTRVHPGDGTHTNDTPMKAAWRSSQRTPACTVTTHEGSSPVMRRHDPKSE